MLAPEVLTRFQVIPDKGVEPDNLTIIITIAMTITITIAMTIPINIAISISIISAIAIIIIAIAITT